MRPLYFNGWVLRHHSEHCMCPMSITPSGDGRSGFFHCVVCRAAWCERAAEDEG